LTLMSVTMSGAIRKITIERGEDPRDFVLFAYGGGGPLHSVELARELSIPQVVVPIRAGVFSALGMLFAEVESDESRTFLAPLNEANFDQAKRLSDGMLSTIKAQLPESRSQEALVVLRHAELRYKGQHHTLRIPWEPDTCSEELQAMFENAYRQRYGHLTVGAIIEFVSVSTIVRHAVERPDLQAMARQATAQAHTTPTSTSREVFLARARQWKTIPVFQRSDLPIGFSHPGPALIEEYGSTCLIDEGDRFQVGLLAEINIDVDLTPSHLNDRATP
jgi:N-methylhydantoinase A